MSLSGCWLFLLPFAPFASIVQRAGSSSCGGADSCAFATPGQSADRRASGCTNAYAFSRSHVSLVPNRASVDIPPDVVSSDRAMDVMMARRLLNCGAGRYNVPQEQTQGQNGAQ